jgi:mycofactocin precursor peptide peptidase
MSLADSRWPDIEAAPRDVLVVPTGSLEQHGPHLPLDTDTVIATAVAAGLHAARPFAGLAPAVPYGASGEHADFPGTLSIGTTALRELMVELVRNASLSWGGVLVINGHGGNLRALTEAAEICSYEGRLLNVVHLGTPGADAHAGRTETSLLLHLSAERVRRDLAEAGVTTPVGELLPELARAGVRAISPNGVLGDPAGATAGEGAQLLEALVDKAIAAYDTLLGTVRARS